MPLSAANLVSSCRIVLAPALVVLAWLGKEDLFLACLIISLTSDIVDGQVARRFNLTSELGTRLDSWADLLTYASVPVAIWLMRPDLVAGERPALFSAIVSYALPVVVGMAKFQCLTTYHTRAARGSALILGAAVVVMLAHGPILPFRVGVCVLALAEAEEICITLVLPEPKSNVRSLRMAFEIRRTSADTNKGRV